MRILVTGGAGYIGSHICAALLRAGHDALILDNLSAASSEVVNRIGRAAGSEPEFIRGDILDPATLDAVFARPADLVIHLAGAKDVGESVRDPLKYDEINVSGTINLLRAMERHGCHKLIFSSSAAVYGQESAPPYKESDSPRPMNPYGWTKLMAERVMADLCRAHSCWQTVVFRYANPVGADASGVLGETVAAKSANLIPMLVKAAQRGEKLRIYGNDYSTPDGTGIRDYLHVTDLAAAHLRCVERFDRLSQFEILNLGTGRGYSVLEVLDAFQRASGRKIGCEFAPRRPGDAGASWLDVAKAEELLAWKAVKSLEDMCRDSWRYANAAYIG